MPHSEKSQRQTTAARIAGVALCINVLSLAGIFASLLFDRMAFLLPCVIVGVLAVPVYVVAQRKTGNQLKDTANGQVILSAPHTFDGGSGGGGD